MTAISAQYQLPGEDCHLFVPEDMAQSLGAANNRGLFRIVVVLEVVGNEDGTLRAQVHLCGKEVPLYAAEAFRDYSRTGGADRLCHVPTPPSKSSVRAIVAQSAGTGWWSWHYCGKDTCLGTGLQPMMCEIGTKVPRQQGNRCAILSAA